MNQILEEAWFARITVIRYRCPSCKVKVDEVHLNKAVDKKLAAKSLGLQNLTATCPECNYKGSIDSFKRKNEKFYRLLSKKDPISSDEKKVEGHLYHCPIFNLNVRVNFAEMCKKCPKRQDAYCLA